MRARNFYAAQHPRGFANEVNVYRFASRQARDAWVHLHWDDGDCNAATLGAYTVRYERAVYLAAREYGVFREPPT